MQTSKWQKISCNKRSFFLKGEGWLSKFLLLKRGGLIEDWYDFVKKICKLIYIMPLATGYSQFTTVFTSPVKKR